MIEIYCDGAFSSSRSKGGWAFVVLKNGEKIYKEFDSIDGGTNNIAEVTAALEAFKWMKKNNYNKAIVYADSMYLIGCASKGWKKKKNVDLWLEMDDAMEGLELEWEHTKGHAGDKWNEYCDMLAVHASQTI